MIKRILWERLSPGTQQNIINSNIELFNKPGGFGNFLSEWCTAQDIKYFRIWHAQERKFVNVFEFKSLDQYVEFCLKYY